MSTETTFGKLDIIINNAGVADELDWEKTLKTNVVSCYKWYSEISRVAEEYTCVKRTLEVGIPSIVITFYATLG